MPLPYANPFLNTKWENKTLKKTQRIAEHKNSAIGRHFLEAHGNNNLLRESQFTVLRKCQSKFDCLVFEMLFIKKLKPNLNIQTDSIRAKLFVWYFLTLQFFNQLLLFFFFSIYRPKITNLFWLDKDVQLTSKRRRFLTIFF